MLRLVADENFNGDILRGLLRRCPALDIVRAQDAGLTGADDPTLLAQPIIHQAIASGRGADEVDVVRQALQAYAHVEDRRQSLRREIAKGVESQDSISGAVVFQQLEQLANQFAACAGEPER